MRNFFTKHKWFVPPLAFILLCVVGLVIFQSKAAKAPSLESDFLLGDYYFNHGPDADGTYNLELARHHFEKALADNPAGDSLAWYQLGRIDFLEGKFDAALYKFDQQIQYFGDSQPSVYYMIALTHGYRARMWEREESWKAAADNFRRYLDFDPDSPWARTDLAWVYFAQGKYQEMLSPLKVGLEKNPDNPWLLNMYGLALLNTGEKEKAREQFIRAKEMAGKLTAEEWGQSYPGNDPSAWSQGLREFRQAIEVNLNLAS